MTVKQVIMGTLFGATALSISLLRIHYLTDVVAAKSVIARGSKSSYRMSRRVSAEPRREASRRPSHPRHSSDDRISSSRLFG